MTVALVKAKLATMQAAITNVKHAYAQAPSILNDADLPAFVNLTGPATDDWQNIGEEADLQTRFYTMRLYVLSGAEGIPGEAERRCEPFFESVRDYFAKRPFLGNMARVQSAYVVGDSGIIRLPFNGPEPTFLGIEFRLQVTEYIRFDYVE